MATIKDLSNGKVRIRIKNHGVVKQTTCRKEEANEKIREIENEFKRHERDTKATRVFNEFLKYKKNRISVQSYTRLRSTVNTHVLPNIENLYWGEINSKIINKTLNNYKGSYSSAKKIKEAFSACDKYALNHGFSEKSIMLGVEFERKESPIKVEIYSMGEIARLTECGINDRYGVVFLFLLYTGLRAGEMCSLKWHDIEEDTLYVHTTAIIDNGEVKIKDTPKSSSSIRSVPLCENALFYLQKIRDFWGGKGLLVYAKNGEPLSPAVLTHFFRRFCEKNNIPRKRNSLHSLRDTFASNLINNGVDVLIVSKLLGHSDSRVTEHHYISIADSKKKDAVARLNFREDSKFIP